MEIKMLTIKNGEELAHALTLPIDLRLKEILFQRRDQLGGSLEDIARFVIVQPGDSLSALETELGFSVFQNVADGTRFGEPDFTPGWEWLADHGHAWEMVFILDDSGFAHVVVVQSSPMQNRLLRALCITYASVGSGGEQ